MKTRIYFLCLLIITATVIISCRKSDSVETSVENKFQARSAFPTYIKLGPDTTYPRTDSFAFVHYDSYLASCGTAPETESPIMGIKVYPILYPTYVTIGWTTYNGRAIPYAKGTKPGVYKFVGSAYILGFRTCDSTYQNVNAYDTITVTILKSRRIKLN